MAQGPSTRERLLEEARRLFWARAYSTVSLREIANAAGADVALISRYFGGKRQLFEATVDLVDGIDSSQFDGPNDLIDGLVTMLSTAPRDPGSPSPLTLILANVSDPEGGDIVRAAYERKWHAPFVAVLQDEAAAALLGAALLGIMVAEKSLHLRGIAEPASPEYEAQLRGLIDAAVRSVVRSQD